MSTFAGIDLASPWAFLVVFALALVDGVIPLVPARTVVIGLGVLAGSGNPAAYPLLGLATIAAFIGDNISYWVGARWWSRISGVLFGGRGSRRVWDWVERQIHRHGVALVALARVLPGGPTPITLTAGLVHLPTRKFRLAAAASACLWSAYAFGVGVFGDTVVGDHPLLALLAGIGLAAAVNLLLRAVMRRRHAGGEVGSPPSVANSPDPGQASGEQSPKAKG